MKWNITLKEHEDEEQKWLLPTKQLAFDGGSNIVYVGIEQGNVTITTMPVSCQSRYTLISLNDMTGNPTKPVSIAVDRKRKLLYVGLSFGAVQVFQLRYDDKKYLSLSNA